MRLRRLELIRYGRFTDSSLELPRGEPDLHIVVGPNEAGKSTVRSAVGDLLFGIPSRSTLNFVHDYGSMRIGAVLERDGEELEVRRRKGKRDTLLAADDSRLPSGEQVLSPFLHGADRSFFERMFSLDHLLLRAGGRDILQGGGDDASQKLFAAGSGIQGLQRRLKSLEDEAARLWTIRRSKDRKFYIAEDRLKAADGRRRDSTVSADRWRELQRAYADRQSEHDRLHAQIDQAERELRKLARIRRVARNVARKSSLEREIESLGSVAELPEGSADRLRDAEEQCLRASLLLKAERSKLDRAKAERASIQWDRVLLGRKGEIESLHQQRIQVKKGIADLPGLKRKLEEEQRKLVGMAPDCGWDGLDADSIVERIPPRSQLGPTRTMLADWSDKSARVASAETAVSEAASQLDKIHAAVEAIGTPRDMRDLAALVAAVTKEHGGIGALVASAQTETTEARAEVDHIYAAMDPLPDSIEAAVRLVPPSVEEVQDWRDRHHELDQRLRAERDQLASQLKERARAAEAVSQLAAEGEPITLKEVLEARKSRDTQWSELRKRFIDDGGRLGAAGSDRAGDPQQLADSYQDAVAQADSLGDLRSDTAESTAKLAEARRRVAVVESELAGIQAEVDRLEQQDQQMVAEWKELWERLPLEPGGPDRMLAWLALRDKLSDAVTRSSKADRRLASLRDQEAQVVQILADELRKLGEDCDGLIDQRLAMVLERANAVRVANDSVAESRGKLESDLRSASEDEEAKQSLLQSERSQLQQLQRDWAALAAKLAIDPEASPREATGLLGAFDAMREVASRIRDLRSDRIEKIERDIHRFRAEARALAGAVAPELVEQDPGKALDELKSRLESAEREQIAAQVKDREIQALEQQIQERNTERRVSEAAINDLRERAGASDIDELWAEIKKADQERSLRESLAKVADTILEDGDGLSMERLMEECSDADMDEIAQRERALASAMEDSRSGFLAARDSLRDAREAFDNVGGSDAAAMAEGARQSALAEIQEIAEQFIQLRAAACLLRWAIERYRSERQGPMLRRAGELFSALTLGSFQHLEVDYNEQDQAQIVGCRPSGERVPTSGMSDGSSDQLYLALRVAALEDYLEQSPQLPFVADDLFINFDDARAAAGFGVLAGLAQHCQVIFFTHHDHLAELAQESLDFPVRVLRIGS